MTTKSKTHQTISLSKSGVRVVGYSMLFGVPSAWAWGAATVLIISEILGIYVELD